MVEDRNKVLELYEKDPIRKGKIMRIGIDIGSTTIKCVVLDDNGALLHKSYERHFAMITEKTREVIAGLIEKFNIPIAEYLRRSVNQIEKWGKQKEEA